MFTSTWLRLLARMMSETHALALFKVSEELVDVEKIVVKEVHVPFDVYVDNIVVKEVEQVVEIERFVVKEVEVPIERCSRARFCLQADVMILRLFWHCLQTRPRMHLSLLTSFV
jgi:hypothetical protein